MFPKDRTFSLVRRIILAGASAALCLSFAIPNGASAQKIVNMELVGFLDLSVGPVCNVSGIEVRVNDVWGYDSASGTHLALVGLCDGTAIVDTSDPATPALLSTVPGPRSAWRDIKTYGQYAFISHDTLDASETAEPVGVQIVDLEDPTFPVVGTLSDVFDRAHNLFVDSERGHLYVTDWKAPADAAISSLHPEGPPSSTNGFRIYDLASPTAPTFLGEFSGCNVHDVSVKDGVAYTACLGAGLHFIDASDPSAPTTLGVFAYPDNFTHNVWPSADGSYVVVTDEEKGQKLKFFHVPSFSSVSFASEYEPFPDILPHNAFILGDYTYVAYYSEGAIVLHSSDPTKPCEIGYYDTWTDPVGPGPLDGFRGAWGIYPFTESGLVYLSDIASGLYVLNFDPPARDPVDVSLVLDLSGSMSSVAVGGVAPKVDVLKDAVELFVETWRPFTVPGDRLSISYFESAVDTAFIEDGDASLFCPDPGSFVADVRGRSTGNLTALGGGLLTAVRSFPVDDRLHAAIVVSDGMQNVSPMVVEAGLEAVFFDLGDTLVYQPSPGASFVAFDDALSTIAELKARGIRVGIITNVPPDWDRSDLEDQLDDSSLLDEFEVVVLSSEAPAVKPDPAIFEYAFSQLTDPPPVSHVAFVTETAGHLSEVVGGAPVGAQAAGMVGILKNATPVEGIDHRIDDLIDVLAIVDSSSTPARHEIVTAPIGRDIYAESGVPGEPRVSLAEYDATIHTIGVGTTPGSKWQELIEDLAVETGGLHHFTSAPDAELAEFLEDDLVAALQTGSVYRIAELRGSLDPGESETARINLVPSVSKLTVRVSWQDGKSSPRFVPLLRPPVEAEGQVPAPLRPGRRSVGGFYEVATWELPHFDRRRRYAPVGAWQVIVSREQDRGEADPARPRSYSASVLLDDSRLKSAVTVPRGPFAAGEAIPVEARFKISDRPLDDVRVEVSVVGPRLGLGGVLAAECASRANAGQPSEDSDPIELCGERLARARSFRDRLGSREHRLVLSKKASGVYAGQFELTEVPGAYRFAWHASGRVDGHLFDRAGRFARTVRVRNLDATSFALRIRRSGDGGFATVLSFTPRDRFGNLLGPGYADRIRATIPGLAGPPSVIDRFDGSYALEADVQDPASWKAASIILSGERLTVPPHVIDDAVRPTMSWWWFGALAVLAALLLATWGRSRFAGAR